jgi:hypothetical protein
MTQAPACIIPLLSKLDGKHLQHIKHSPKTTDAQANAEHYTEVRVPIWYWTLELPTMNSSFSSLPFATQLPSWNGRRATLYSQTFVLHLYKAFLSDWESILDSANK